MTADELLAAGWRRWAGRYPGQVGGVVTARALLAHSGSWVGGWGGGEPAGSVEVVAVTVHAWAWQ